ncbi:MAG TPA: hypothetical protein VJ725_23935 [Thermoanaerobaculia bacterium]|nr:hypothetical protein [Thermoanaerobaculia bacterium]
MATEKYIATARFLNRFYGSAESETLAHIAALEALGSDREQRISLAFEIHKLLSDPDLTPRDLARFLSEASHRYFETPEEARKFLQRVYEANLFDVLVEIESPSEPDSDA